VRAPITTTLIIASRAVERAADMFRMEVEKIPEAPVANAAATQVDRALGRRPGGGCAPSRPAAATG
jgi:hypothetical protein